MVYGREIQNLHRNSSPIEHWGKCPFVGCGEKWWDDQWKEVHYRNLKRKWRKNESQESTFTIKLFVKLGWSRVQKFWIE
jgi:hypothetical protein